jgi:hypothetical protein
MIFKYQDKYVTRCIKEAPKIHGIWIDLSFFRDYLASIKTVLSLI